MSAALSTLPDTHGRFGPYGGIFVPETLMVALRQLGVTAVAAGVTFGVGKAIGAGTGTG